MTKYICRLIVCTWYVVRVARIEGGQGDQELMVARGPGVIVCQGGQGYKWPEGQKFQVARRPEVIGSQDGQELKVARSHNIVEVSGRACFCRPTLGGK